METKKHSDGERLYERREYGAVYPSPQKLERDTFFFPFWVGVRVEAFDIPKRLDVRSCYLRMYLEV